MARRTMKTRPNQAPTSDTSKNGFSFGSAASKPAPATPSNDTTEDTAADKAPADKAPSADPFGENAEDNAPLVSEDLMRGLAKPVKHPPASRKSTAIQIRIPSDLDLAITEVLRQLNSVSDVEIKRSPMIRAFAKRGMLEALQAFSEGDVEEIKEILSWQGASYTGGE